MVDSGGINRVKCVPLDKLAQATRSGMGFSRLWATALSNDHFTATDALSGPSGDIRLLPDPASLVQLVATPAWAWAALDQYEQDGEVFACCQRSFLKHMVQTARDRGYTLQMAYELEWYTAHVEADSSFTPIHQGPGYSSGAWAQVHELAADLLGALEGQGMAVEQFHPEYSLGQMEVSFGPTDPVTTADWNVLFRHTVRSVSAQRGCRASFAPVTILGQGGNGCHIHFSLWNSAGDNLFAEGSGVVELTAEGEAFLAGVLAELPALVALACPTVPSYERLQPQHWAGAYQVWGHENREAALRFIQGMAGGRRQTANMEFKAIDCAGHPYLVPGAIIAAGLSGIQRNLRLPEPVSVDPFDLSEAEQRARDIRRLPASLAEAAEALAASEVLHEAMGDLLFDSTVAVRRAEAETDEGKTLKQLVADHLWRF
ncbi:MAG: glutamine synthetase family protein [Thermoleophilia bacterium]